MAVVLGRQITKIVRSPVHFCCRDLLASVKQTKVRFASTFRAAYLNQFQEPLRIKETIEKKKLKDEEVSFKI